MTSSEIPTKNLKVLVNDVEYVNADFAEVTVSDGPNGVRVQALPFVSRATNGGGGSSAIIEALTAVVAARAEAKAQAADAATEPEQGA